MDIYQIEDKIKELKKLDSEIVKLRVLADALLNEDHEVILNFKIKKTQMEKDIKIGFDQDGSLIYGQPKYPEGGLFEILKRRYEENLQQESDDEFLISDRSALTILGFLMERVTYNRTELINELKQLGIKI